MNQTNSLFPQLDPLAERRRVLAKVYRLLLRLAEEAEKITATPAVTIAVEEQIQKPLLATIDSSN